MLVTRTGWTFDEADNACLGRVFELLRFIGKKAKRSPRGLSDHEPVATASGMWAAPDENVFMEQAAGVQAFLSKTGAGPLPTGQLSKDQREAIGWAEKMQARLRGATVDG